MALKVPCLARFGINIIAAIPQESEVILCDPGHLKEHIILRMFFKIFQGKVTIAIGHDEAGNCAGESPQMCPDFFLNGAFFLFFLMTLQPLNDFLRLFRDCFLHSRLNRCHESLHGGTHIRLILRLCLLNLFLSLGLAALIFQAGSGQLLLLCIVIVDLVKSPVDLFLYLALQSALSTFFDAVLFHGWRQDFLLDIAFYRSRNIF